MPLLTADLNVSWIERESWVGDGATSFYFLMYDVSRRCQAVVRVSRHLVLLAGTSCRGDAILGPVGDDTDQVDSLGDEQTAVDENADVASTLSNRFRHTSRSTAPR